MEDCSSRKFSLSFSEAPGTSLRASRHGREDKFCAKAKGKASPPPRNPEEESYTTRFGFPDPGVGVRIRNSCLASGFKACFSHGRMRQTFYVRSSKVSPPLRLDLSKFGVWGGRRQRLSLSPPRVCLLPTNALSLSRSRAPGQR